MERFRQRKEQGRAAEQHVEALLVAQGWQLLERRWRCRHGEIDLLLQQPGQLLIVEVKYRSATGLSFAGGAEHCLTWAQHRRLRQTFALWLQTAPQWSDCVVSIALAVVSGGKVVWPCGLPLANAMEDGNDHLG